MSVKQSDYETLLAEYSNCDGAIALLRQHRPYLEMIPSLRRPQESLISLPLPITRIRQPLLSPELGSSNANEAVCLPCDLAMIMCDPEWKIKLGVEIIVLIHRPQEDFSDLLRRWRQTQIYLDKDYEWLMPPPEQHMFSEAAEQVYPLFVVFEETPARIKRGLTGAGLPFVTHKTKLQEKSESHQESRLGIWE